MKRCTLIKLFLVLPLLFCLSCGIRDGFELPVATKKNVELYIFSAEWCTNCKIEMEELDRLLNTDLPGKKNQVKITVQVVTDINKGPPSPQAVAQYQQHMLNQYGLDYHMVMDPWPFQTYRKYFEFTGGDIPAAVLLEEDLTVIKTFKARMKAVEIIDQLISILS